MNRGRWFLLRAYLWVVLLVVVVGIGLEALLMQRDQQVIAEREVELVQGGFLFADSLFAQSSDITSSALESKLSEHLLLPVAVLTLGDFAGVTETHAPLIAGKTLQLYDSEDRILFYRRIASSDWVLQLGPATELTNERAQWVVPLFYGLIALAVYLWIRPLMRDLDDLQSAAQAFGMQDFSARTALPPRSWLAPLGEAFNSMAQRIEWLLQSHRELTHAVSHELRTPLARLRFGIEMLKSGDDVARNERLVAMNDDVDELNELIEEMLGYAELEAGNLRAHCTVLEPDWLEQYVSYYNSHPRRVPLTLDVMTTATLCADERLLRRALDNLAGNAQRFASSAISLSLRVEKGECQLCVADDGPGVPEGQRASILSAYVRLNNEQGEGRRGFGLGLAIVKRIMELHRGRVEIDASESGGALFKLIWPVSLADANV